MFSQVEHDAFI